MIGRLPRPKRNRNAGKQPRAIWYRRWARLIRRKRIAWERAKACDMARQLQRQFKRIDGMAKFYRVPLEAMPTLPVIPTLLGQEWIEHRQAIGPLVEPVKAAPPERQTGHVMA